jgi:prepilin-type N-terminal cleavage/methylation domain-containing protein
MLHNAGNKNVSGMSHTEWVFCLKLNFLMMKTISRNTKAFTLIELLVVIAIIAILAAILMPVLSSAKNRADEIYCLNNMRQWGLAFHMYSDDNSGYVPEEGNTAAAINDPGSPGATPNYTIAWYNVVPAEIGSVSLVDLYGANGYTPEPPVPTSHSLFSCPSCLPPDITLGYRNPPVVTKAFFMYGENARLCVNWSTRYDSSGNPTGVQQTKMVNVLKPSQTVFLAEVDPNAETGGSSTVTPSQSNVTAYYSIGRHNKSKTVGNLAMCDGSSVSLHTNMYWESQGEADGFGSNNGQVEWAAGPQIYWYPSPTTPN